MCGWLVLLNLVFTIDPKTSNTVFLNQNMSLILFVPCPFHVVLTSKVIYIYIHMNYIKNWLHQKITIYLSVYKDCEIIIPSSFVPHLSVRQPTIEDWCLKSTLKSRFCRQPTRIILVGGWEHEFYDFPYIGKNHPNWRTHIFQRGSNHQPDMLSWFFLHSFSLINPSIVAKKITIVRIVWK